MRSSPLRHPALAAGASLLRLQSDERLSELAVGGHEAAFDAIVDRYRAPLQRYCAGIVGPSRAEDAVQQTLINAHDALKRTDEVRHLRSWLYRIAHNTSLNVLRAVRDDASLDDAADPAVAALAADGDAPDAAFERSEQFRATVDALRELPERQRAALVLRELEGRSHEEIAEALGVTKGSARQHLLRARIAMRAAVTAITPYPLLIRLAEALGGSGSTGWADAAAGAGVGATLAKLTAGVVATGALVGGAVQTEHAVQRHHGSTVAAAPAHAPKAAKGSVVRGMAVALPATTGRAAGGGGAGSSATSGSSATGDDGHSSGDGRGRDDERPGKDDGPDGSQSGGASGRRSGSSGSHGAGKGSRDDDNRSSSGSSGKDKSQSSSGKGSSGSRKGSSRSGKRSSRSRKGSSGSRKRTDGARLAGTMTTPATGTALSTAPSGSGSDGSDDATTSGGGSSHRGSGNDD